MKITTRRIVIAATALGLMGADWRDLNEQIKQLPEYKQLKEQIRQIRDAIRKLRGKEPAPPPPAPPESVQTPGAAPVPGLTFQGNCVAKEETGYAENAKLQVALGEVRALEARVVIPKRGSCSFRLKDFRQTQRSPIVELLAQSSGSCSLRIWQQQDRITMVATDCPDKCSGGSFEYLWPIEFKAPEGGCY